MSRRFKVFFHSGEELVLATRAQKGFAEVTEAGLGLAGADGSVTHIARETVRSVRMFRLHGLGRVIQLDHDGGRVFVSVVRLMIGQFAFINFFGTGTLKNILAAMVDR